MSSPPREIVIVGGGTAGWMTAAALSRFLERGWRIRLIESDEIGTVGVGEATIPQIRLFLQALGIDEDAFVRGVNGTFKLGVQFDGWTRAGESYIHSFTRSGPSLGLLPFHQYWLRAHAEGWAEPLDSYSVMSRAALDGRFARTLTRPDGGLPPPAWAFHIDSSLMARHLRAYAEARGVERREGRVVGVQQESHSGQVTRLALSDGGLVEGELFIDCSGFRALLIGEAMGVAFEDWSHWLPCDRALAVGSERQGPAPSFTRATADAAGWRWRIPLQHRTGNGYVYCSRYTRDEEAAAALLAGLDGPAIGDPRPLRFTAGKRADFWVRNCVAIGLSAGFLEPLESTSIHLIQSAIARLLAFLPGPQIDPADVAAFNRQTHAEWDRIRDFLILHYKATERDDLPFWRDRRAMPIPPSLQEKIEVFSASGRVLREEDELFTESSWVQVMLGQGVTPRGRHPLADQLTSEELRDFLQGVKMLGEGEVARMPSHSEFIARCCAA